ncbi:MAG TPA: RdgB/HAM1 family non-canonical purine NTP pyrophosphatase [Chthoniobacteraceae bacterium]|jgi:XTP/dITP diphosphohydrolase|nr:RdgB/HAM1 family non-canonical purine NTP pyrophosphatase [Chthoniobacteraceae bacterium]
MTRHLFIATRNRHKTGEFAAILGPGWTVEDISERKDLPEPEETGATFEENALIKALAASEAIEGVVLADDSGLEVDLLDGAPGVRSARYAGPKATDQQNRERLLAELSHFNHAAEEPVAARFRCVIAIAENGRKLATFSGSVEGRIVLAEAGAGGFGYDPLFIPEGFSETFGELDAATKNSLSHRARAMAEAMKWLTGR